MYMAILDLYNQISNLIDKNEFIISIFVDLAKAFDTLDYSILYGKLYYYGIRGVALDLLKSYLTNRQQYVNYFGVS